MAKKATVKGKLSSGNRSKINAAREERRQAKFAKKREEGCAYEYKPIPFEKDSNDYWNEKCDRAAKNVSTKTPLARITSLMCKLDNQLAKEKMVRKERKERNNNSRVKTT